MVIFTPVLSEEEFLLMQQKYKDLIETSGGSIVHSNPWGLKVLAYPINKKTTGLFWVVEFECSAEVVEKLKIALLREDAVMRHVFTRLDKHGIHYNFVKRTGGFTKYNLENPKAKPKIITMIDDLELSKIDSFLDLD